MTTIKNVNGPINYYRLKNNKKDIYIFFDIHKDLYYQTKCNNNEENIDIDNLLEVFFTKNNDKMIDFLLETPSGDTQLNFYKNDKYILKIWKMFNDLHFTQKILKNENTSKFLRLHYTNIRYKINTFNCHFCDNNFNNFLINNKIIEILNIYQDYLKKYSLLYEYIAKIKNIVDKKTDNIVKIILESDKNIGSLEQELIKILDKILLEKNYNDKKNYDIINNYFDEYIIKKMQYFLFILNENYILFEKYNFEQSKNNTFVRIHNDKTYKKYMEFSSDAEEYKKNIQSIITKTEEIFSISDDLHCFIMDCYFLRRFLDKNYITNVISYSGAFHSINYIWFLIKYYDFEIIEVAQSKYNKDEIIKHIKKNDFYDSYNTIWIHNKTKQCIQLKYPFFN